MEKAILTPSASTNIKTVEIIEEGNKHKCQIQAIKAFIQVSIFSGNALKYEGSISLPKIQNQIYAFTTYSINEIFEEINLLDTQNFNLIKEEEKYKLKIEFTILRKKINLFINLNDDKNMNLNKDDLISTITELKQIIKIKDEKIKLLEQELKKYTNSIPSIKSDNSYDNFNIKLKEPIHQLKFQGCIYCATLLKDGRFVTGSTDSSIIIYNNKTFQPDLTIKEHSGSVYCVTQLKSGVLASCSTDKTIKLFNINGNEYNVIQILNYHKNYVYKIMELSNQKLVSCSNDNSIIFYFKDNNEYKKDFQITTKGSCSPVIQTKQNEICYSEDTDKAICFFDLLERKAITSLKNINKRIGTYDWFIMMTKNLLLITGENILTIINVDSHSVVRTINVTNSSWINAACLLTNNMLLTVDNNKIIIQWKIEGDNLVMISRKEKASENCIGTVLKIGDGLIITGDDGGIIKVW